MTTEPTPSAPLLNSRIRVDKGDYFMLVSDLDQIRSFSVSWTDEDMKKPTFQAWLDYAVAKRQREIPHGFVLFDSYMSTVHKNMVSKSWRYAHNSTISIEPKGLNPDLLPKPL